VFQNKIYFLNYETARVNFTLVNRCLKHIHYMPVKAKPMVIR